LPVCLPDLAGTFNCDRDDNFRDDYECKSAISPDINCGLDNQRWRQYDYGEFALFQP